MKRPALAIALVLVVVAAALALYFWSTGSGRVDPGLATQFPAQTEVYVELGRLGQWMELPQGAETASAPAPRGTDPLLQVLGQVWAAEPLRPQDLPALLKEQPMALGLWKAGEKWEAVGLLPLEPGQRAALEPFLQEKLKGEPAGEVAGLPMRQVAQVKEEGQEYTLLWGVDDKRAVVATSLEAARKVLAPSGGSLADTPAFRRARGPLPSDKGALLFVSGTLARSLGTEEMKQKAMALLGQARKDEAPAAPPDGEGAPATPADEGEAALGALADQAMVSATKFLSPESVLALAAWTAPPEGARETWEVMATLAYADKPQGLWKVLSESGKVRPTLDDRVPKDGNLYSWVGGFDLAGGYRSLLQEAEKTLPQDQVGNLRAAIGFMEGKVGLSLSNDLLPTVGDEALYVSHPAGEETRWALLLALKDSRRFESLVGEKVAPALTLSGVEFPGARGWKVPGEMTLLVSGGLAILSDDPQWALATGGVESRAFKGLREAGEPASGLLAMTPEKAGQAATSVSWSFNPDGVVFKAQVPGDPLRIPLGEKPAEATPAAGPSVTPGA